jgi:putative transposase
VLYLVIRNPIANRANVTRRTTGWKAALNALALFYGDRITLK